MKTICVFGVGYVGLPLAIEFSKKFKVIGYDNDIEKIKKLKSGIDINNDLKKEEIKVLRKRENLRFSSSLKDIIISSIFIITVPTPIKKNKKPDLSYVKSATKEIGKILKKGDLVIYESTVYPGTTDDICIPLLENNSGLKLNKDFHVGYSPERLSPGNKSHGLKNIIKITSGSDLIALKKVDNLYKKIINKGTYKAESIKVAEAAKVIENTQRDINIAFINELVFLFSKLNINTNEVLKAAETKWNFARFQPGLVGGHCIAVDPYYLEYIAEKKGYKSKLIRPSRRINDKMANFVCNKTMFNLKKRGFNIKKTRILILGFAYKENCSDTRNTPIYNIYKNLINKVKKVDIFDPIVNQEQVFKKFKIKIINKITLKYQAIIFAVPHNEIFSHLKKCVSSFKRGKNFVIDIKYVLKSKKYDVISI